MYGYLASIGSFGKHFLAGTLLVLALGCRTSTVDAALPIATSGADKITRGAEAVSGNSSPPSTSPGVMPPPGIARLIPARHELLFYEEQPAVAPYGAFAVAVMQPANEPDARRTLLVAEPHGNGWREAVRNDRVVACSTCGELLDDPFADRRIELAPGKIRLDQRHGGLRPSSSHYEFRTDPASGRWDVAVVEEVRQTLQESGEWAREVTRDQRASGMPAAQFDAKWRKPEYWNAIVADERTRLTTSIFNKPDRTSLDAAIRSECASAGKCRTLALQLYGCMAASVDAAGRFHVSRSTSDGSESTARRALEECNAGGAEGCRVVAEGCSVGVE